MHVWVYRSRSGNHGVFKGDLEGFARARCRQDEDNRCTVDEAAEMGLDVSGSYEQGYFAIDDGGSIYLSEVVGE